MISVSQWSTGIAGGIGFGVLWAAFLWVVFLWPWPGDQAEHRLCDEMVQLALTSRDPVELQRAAIFIQTLNCAIGRRLPQNR